MVEEIEAIAELTDVEFGIAFILNFVYELLAWNKNMCTSLVI